MASKKTVKEVTFIARCQFKSDHRKVVYRVYGAMEQESGLGDSGKTSK